MKEPVRCHYQSKREFTECTHIGNQECRNEFTKDVKVVSIHGGIIIAFHQTKFSYISTVKNHCTSMNILNLSCKTKTASTGNSERCTRQDPVFFFPHFKVFYKFS